MEAKYVFLVCVNSPYCSQGMKVMLTQHLPLTAMLKFPTWVHCWGYAAMT